MERIPQSEVDKFQRAGKKYQVVVKTENEVESNIEKPYEDMQGAEACLSFIQDYAKNSNPDCTLSFYIKEV